MAIAAKHSEIEQMLDGLEARLTETQRRFEQYFIGVDRNIPKWFRDDCKRRIKDLRKVIFVNTGQRFKFQSLIARLTLFEAYWDRILKQIEEGTYKKHRFLAARHLEEREKERLRVGRETARKSKEAGSQDQAAPDAAENDFARRVHAAYLKARQQTGEATAGITVETINHTLQKQRVALRQKFGDQQFEFKVVIKEGKAILKAVPKNQPRE